MPDNTFRSTSRDPIPAESVNYNLENAIQRYRQIDLLRQYVREGNAYAARQVITERFQAKSAGRIPDELTELKYDLVLLCGLMGQSLREAGIEELHLEHAYTSSIRKINSAAAPGECRELAAELAENYCGLGRPQFFHSYSPLVKEIILAVDMDLGKPLTLSYFSEMLNVNSSYLSGLFKKETGTSLTEYVTARRILRAEDLLITSQLPIKTIAEQVGIPDVHYFSRIFKRKTGQTPSRYRACSSYRDDL